MWPYFFCAGNRSDHDLGDNFCISAAYVGRYMFTSAMYHPHVYMHGKFRYYSPPAFPGEARVLGGPVLPEERPRMTSVLYLPGFSRDFDCFDFILEWDGIVG